jgi:hypothetical protein
MSSLDVLIEINGIPSNEKIFTQELLNTYQKIFLIIPRKTFATPVLNNNEKP